MERSRFELVAFGVGVFGLFVALYALVVTLPWLTAFGGLCALLSICYFMLMHG